MLRQVRILLIHFQKENRHYDKRPFIFAITVFSTNYALLSYYILHFYKSKVNYILSKTCNVFRLQTSLLFLFTTPITIFGNCGKRKYHPSPLLFLFYFYAIMADIQPYIKIC